MIWLAVAEEGIKIGDFALAREVADLVKIVAIVCITAGVLVSLIAGLVVWIRSGGEAGFDTFKHYIARGLLVGLDLLIAADVIETVTIEGTIESAVVLGLLVVIRTFLSWTLVLEVEGCWPWQRERRRAEA